MNNGISASFTFTFKRKSDGRFTVVLTSLILTITDFTNTLIFLNYPSFNKLFIDIFYIKQKSRVPAISLIYKVLVCTSSDKFHIS